MKTLTEDSGQKDLTETTDISTCYPGIPHHYYTHHFVWKIKDEFTHIYSGCGLPIDAQKRNLMPHGCDFVSSHPEHALCRWVPQSTAQELLKLSTVTFSDTENTWAKQVFMREGRIPAPKTEGALACLFYLCNINVCVVRLAEYFRKLHSKRCYLQLSGGQLIFHVEMVFVRIRLSARDAMSGIWEVVQVGKEGPEDHGALMNKMLRTDEVWEAAAVRCITEELQLAKQDVNILLDLSSSVDFPSYMLHVERKKSTHLLGLLTATRSHLVTYSALKESGFRGVHSASNDILLSSHRSRQRRKTMETRFVWLRESQLDGIRGVQLWDEAKRHSRHRSVSSVLIGLESSSPLMTSPFGLKHGPGGTSNPMSALGCQKWRAYRASEALQIPADVGGLKVTVTSRSFKDLRETCEKIDLVDPLHSLLLEPSVPKTRELLFRCSSEATFFKEMLASTGSQARLALEQILESRALTKTV